jgi:hypothetical protein
VGLTSSRRLAAAVAVRLWQPPTHEQAANGSPRSRPLGGQGLPVQRPSRRTPRRPVRVRPCGQQLRPERRPGRQPQRREHARRGQHRQRRTDGGSRRRCPARRASMPEYARCHPSGGCQPELPPRTRPTHALRSPPPKPRRPAGLPRSRSAAKSRHDSLTPAGLNRPGFDGVSTEPRAVHQLDAPNPWEGLHVRLDADAGDLYLPALETAGTFGFRRFPFFQALRGSGGATPRGDPGASRA